MTAKLRAGMASVGDTIEEEGQPIIRAVAGADFVITHCHPDSVGSLNLRNAREMVRRAILFKLDIL